MGASLGVCLLARGVYAPVPEQEQGKDLTLSLETGITYNNNIFGAAEDRIGSLVFEVSPKLVYDVSITDTTFFSASYQPSFDYFENRPGSKDLFNQAVDLRVAHAFSKTSTLDVNDAYSYNQNPESLLNGGPVNVDQTLQTNEFDTRYTFAPTEKIGVALKARTVYFDYTNPTLGDELNRFENLYGIESDFLMLPDFKLAGEYRHQDVDYLNAPSENNKHSDFLMAGFDYAAGPKLTASVRVGGEYRQREGLPSQTVPYAEASARYAYAKGAYVAVGYSHSLEETSDPFHYSDEKVNRIFMNVQQPLTALIVASASVDYEPATLDGRPGVPDISEDSTHTGAAISYLPTKNWTVTGSYDYDFVDSGISSRGLNRSRIGVSATVVF